MTVVDMLLTAGSGITIVENTSASTVTINSTAVGGVSAITGSSIMSDTSGSIVKHNASAVTPGAYVAANLTVDNFGHITTVANGISASSVGAPVDSPFITSGSASSLTNYSVLTGGSNISVLRTGSVITVATTIKGITSITGSSIMSDTTGSIIKHNVSGVASGLYNLIQVDVFGHIISGSVTTGGTGGPPKVYGVKWDKSSSPTLTRTDDAVGLQAIPGLGTETPVNTFDTAEIYKDIVQVTDALGNVFMRIPKFYIKKSEGIGTSYRTIQISTGSFASGGYLPYCFWNFSASAVLPYIDVGKYNAYKTSGSVLESKTGLAPAASQTITTFRTWATNNNTGGALGYQQLDLHTVDVLQCLFYVEFATLNSQSIVAGYTGGANTSARPTGDCDAVTATTGGVTSLTSGSASFKYRGIEQLWGNVWQFVDGVNINNGVASVCLNPANYVVDKWTTDNYTAIGYTNGSTNGYTISMGYDSNYPFAQFPTGVSGGGETTYYSDYCYFSTGSRIAGFGGDWSGAAVAGVSGWFLNGDSTFAFAALGARLLKKPL